MELLSPRSTTAESLPAATVAAVTGDGDGPDGGGGGGDCLRGGMTNANVFATVLMSKSAIVINERAYFQESGYLIRARTQKLWLADTVKQTPGWASQIS